MSSPTGLQLEWQTLQNQFDHYEKLSLVIKLLSVTLTAMIAFAPSMTVLFFWLCAVLWLQDAIWKTFQGRIFDRILLVERAMTEQHYHKAMQFNSSWLETRFGFSGLLAEYATNLFKPTIAFPHVVLVVISGYFAFW